MKRPLVCLTAVFLTACGPDLPPPDAPVERLNPDAAYQPVSGEPTTDDIARFLAGRPVNNGAELSRRQRASDNYRRDALEFDYRWRNMTSKRRSRQTDYYEETLRPRSRLA